MPENEVEQRRVNARNRAGQRRMLISKKE